MLRRTKREVEGELPGKAEHVLRCDLSAWQQLWYRQIAEEVRLFRLWGLRFSGGQAAGQGRSTCCAATCPPGSSSGTARSPRRCACSGCGVRLEK